MQPFTPWNIGADPGAASEDACLALVDELFPSRSEHVPEGRGDDCAELHFLPQVPEWRPAASTAPEHDTGEMCGEDDSPISRSVRFVKRLFKMMTNVVALSTDFFWEGAHFRTRYFTPEEAGAKALAVAASDLAAAGAAPLGFSLGLMLPPSLELSSLRRLLTGMAEQARACGLTLSGGDLSRGTQLGFCITVWGVPAVPEKPFLRRAGALPGDVIFLVGECGLAGVGLWALESMGRQQAVDAWPAACAAHLRPRPLLTEGQALAKALTQPPAKDGAIRVMDVSDGLARDLPRLLAERGADLHIDDADLHDELFRAARAMGREPLELFMEGGEDYALLGTCEESLVSDLLRAVPTAKILGRVTDTPGLRLNGTLWTAQGFDHFSGTDAAEHSDAVTAQAATRSIAEACHLVGASGLNAGRHGNISCRVPVRDGGQQGSQKMPDKKSKGISPAWYCCITCTGTMKSMAEPEDTVLLAPDGAVLNLVGNTVGRSGRGPSSESGLHLALYELCPDAQAIVHVHPPHLLALELRLPPKERLHLTLSEASAVVPRLAFVPALPPGSTELADAVADAARSHPAVWMETHGLVTHGASLREALALAEELEHLARIHLLSL